MLSIQGMPRSVGRIVQQNITNQQKCPIKHGSSESSNEKEHRCNEHVDTDARKTIFYGKNQTSRKYGLYAWISLCAVGQVKEEIQVAGPHMNGIRKQIINAAQVEQ